MEYSKLVAVTGLPGLYELINSKNDGAVVRSLQDKTTRFAATRTHQFSHLESIEIYTTGENVNLADVFKAIENSGVALPDVKDEKALKAYFEKVFPEMDFDRVYNSDMKKMVKWFEILKKNDIEIKPPEPPAEAFEEVPVEEVAEETKKQEEENKKSDAEATGTENKPAKKKTAAKKPPVKEKTQPEAGKDKAPQKAAPKKKTATKKKAE